MPQKPSTCIIGAGISGLTAGKALTDWGLPYTCFESSDDIGGNWYFGNPNGASSAYQSLHIDTSRDGVSFRDMPMGPDEYPDYPHHAQILGYLHRYADAFSLRDRIRFETPVEHAERKEGGGWRITLRDGSTHEFDFLIVGNGHHWDPRYPDFPGSFDGEVIHGHHYIGPSDPLDLYGKRVLVVGIGNSGVDITSELSRKGVAERVFISTRSGAWVVPKYFLGRPLDTLVKINPRLPVKLQRLLARPLPRLASAGWRTSVSPSQPPLHGGASDRLQRTAPATRLRRRGREAERLRARGRQRPLRGRQRRADRRDHLRHGYTSPSRSSTRSSSRRRRTGCRSSSGSSSRASTTSR
jgi:glycine/D-amino acid oxidase-like deaminating enzyme